VGGGGGGGGGHESQTRERGHWVNKKKITQNSDQGGEVQRFYRKVGRKEKWVDGGGNWDVGLQTSINWTGRQKKNQGNLGKV